MSTPNRRLSCTQGACTPSLINKTLECFQQALDVCISSGCDDKYIAAMVHVYICNTLRYQGKLDQAMEMHEESMWISRRLRVEDHSSIASGYNKLGIILFGKGDFDGAMANYILALDWYGKRLGENTLSLIGILSDVGESHRDVEQLDVAMQYFHRALSSCKHADFEDLSIAAIIQNEIGKTSRLLGKIQVTISINLKIYTEKTISASSLDTAAL